MLSQNVRWVSVVPILNVLIAAMEPRLHWWSLPLAKGLQRLDACPALQVSTYSKAESMTLGLAIKAAKRVDEQAET